MATKKTATKASAKKTVAKKATPAKKTAAKKTVAKKATPAKKTAAKKTAAKSAGRRYSPAAGANVEREMKAMKEGKLKSGSGAKVTNPKQAIAIGLSEARKAGKKVPPPPEK
jgi:hypothetical protein